MSQEIRVAVSGAAGRMGLEVVRAVHEAEGLMLVAAIDPAGHGSDIGELAGIGSLGIAVAASVDEAQLAGRAEVLVEFSPARSAVCNIKAALRQGCHAVVGSTGIDPSERDRLGAVAEEAGLGLLVAPNFAIGAVLMMRFAEEAARYMPDVEVIELHHEKKLDSPSGTAMETAARIARVRSGQLPMPEGQIEKSPGARGASPDGVPVHSIRLPGLVAHQEVLFGALGQTLSIRHDSIDRRSFMPGVVLAIRRIGTVQGLRVGLEHVMTASGAQG